MESVFQLAVFRSLQSINPSMELGRRTFPQVTKPKRSNRPDLPLQLHAAQTFGLNNGNHRKPTAISSLVHPGVNGGDPYGFVLAPDQSNVIHVSVQRELDDEDEIQFYIFFTSCWRMN